MAHYSYKAKRGGPSGEIYSGDMEAADRYEVYKKLKEAGDEVVLVDESSGKKKLFSFSLKGGTSFKLPFTTGVKAHEKIIFARNLGSMLEAGLTVSRAMSVMQRQTKNKVLKDILDALVNEISSGKTLSDAMMAYPKVFSSLFISMVRAGEASGTLASSLKVVGLQMEKSYALTKRIKGAMMYPCIIFFAMVLVTILLLIYIVPTLTKTFTELKVDLPTSTKIVIGISNAVKDHGLVLLLVVVAIIAGIYAWSKKPQGKKVLHRAMLYIPIIGEIIKEVNAARTARTLSSLITSGVDIVEATKITEDVIQNVHYKAILHTAGETIQKGEPMSKVFTANTKLYPVFLGEMISVGEETGKIGEMLVNVAVYYEDDVEQKTKDMSTIIEPFLMIAIGAAVGFFAVAMISPMYSLADAI
jgi:type IV pilus assembly protein PilC